METVEYMGCSLEAWEELFWDRVDPDDLWCLAILDSTQNETFKYHHIEGKYY